MESQLFSISTVSGSEVGVAWSERAPPSSVTSSVSMTTRCWRRCSMGYGDIAARRVKALLLLAWSDNHGCCRVVARRTAFHQCSAATAVIRLLTCTALPTYTTHQPCQSLINNQSKGKKGKGRYSSSWEPHLRATGRHLPYGITQCYLPSNTSEHTPSHAGWYILDLPTPEGWKAELT